MSPDASKHVGLRVYRSRKNPEGWWCAEYDELTTPMDWDFLEAGNAYVTRKAKELGPHWIVIHSSRTLRLTITDGILAPRINIEKARQLAEETKQRREEARERSRRQREKTNQKRAEEFRVAVIKYLNFDPKHSELADRIAREATETAMEPGSGRVGRTSKLTMEDKARLAAEATIRHSYTNYDETLETTKAGYGLASEGEKLDENTYRELKQDAAWEVAEYLTMHRKKDTNGT
jgi:hypothetical protein